MKIGIILSMLAAIFVWCLPLAADDGSWSDAFTIEGGGIYAETDHPQVSLAKELIVFDGYKTVAYFLYKNTAPKPVTVTCGFPVKITISTYREGDYLHIPVGRYDRPGGITGLRYFETAAFSASEDNSMEPDFDYSERILVNDFNNSREFLPPEAAADEVTFDITLDGKPVPIDSVLLERHAGDDGAWLIFHHKHDLHFAPGQTSVLRVEYAHDLVTGMAGGIRVLTYEWHYLIGTGGTWKGPIGDFYLIKPADWHGQVTGLHNIFSDDNLEIHHAKDYEPEEGEAFSLHKNDPLYWEIFDIYEDLKSVCFDAPVRLPKPSVPAEACISSIHASSFLPETVSVFTSDGIIQNADFAPLSLFDGKPETAWCEGVPGPGLGEYVSFKTSLPLFGLTVRSGFTRFTVFPDEFFSSGDFADQITAQDKAKGIKDYFNLNNRPSRLDVVSEGVGVLYTLYLLDTRDIQSFPYVFLPPGSYKLVIREVYRGTAWDDTCIGEVGFMAAFDDGIDPELRAFAEDDLLKQWLTDISF